MIKRLDESVMQSELAGSAFFSPAATVRPAGTLPTDSPAQPITPSDAAPSGAMNASPFARTPVRRTITRCAFEFYQDQLDRLRRYALEAKTRGEKGSMSEMVREAVDLYLSGYRPGA